MRYFTLLFGIIALLQFPMKSKAAALPSAIVKDTIAIDPTTKIYTLKAEELNTKYFEKVLGHPLKFKEKLAIKILKLQLKLSGKQTVSIPITPEQELKFEKQALWAKWLGIGSLVGMLIPIVSYFTLPAAIIALIFGITTLKKTKNPKNSKQGIIFGSITILLYILIIGIVAILIIGTGVR